MNKTKIEWCDYTINPVKGLCPMVCSYCYARRMYQRFKRNPEVRFEPEVFIDAADKAGIPVFLKNNLRPILKNVYGNNLPLRQEYPRI